MKPNRMLMSACAVLALGITSARADCAAELAALESGAMSSGTTSSGGAISKDGRVAPLGTAGSTTGATAPADAASAGAGANATASGSSSSGSATAGSGTSAQGTTTNFESNTQTAADGATAPVAGGAIVQDGTTAPLAAEAGQSSTGVANSDQDAMAQQSATAGGTSSETTASLDASSSMRPQMTAALEKARAAQQSGNEAACMAALQDARAATN